jgi:hypothetical protein
MLRNRVIQVCLLVWAAFLPAAALLPRMYLFDLINALTTGIGGAIILAFWPGMRESICKLRRPGTAEAGHYLVLGLLVFTTIWVFRTDWIAIWRALGEPDRGLDHIVFALAAWCVFPAAVLLLLSPKLLRGSVPRAGWAMLWNAFGVSAFLFVGLVCWRWAHS